MKPMESQSGPRGRRVFLIAVHDVAPLFQAEIDHILEALNPLVGRQLSGAIVPCWHGQHPDEEGIRQFRSWNDRFGELLLHGCTHFRSIRPGLVSWLTGRADEFSGMSPENVQKCLSESQSHVRTLFGTALRGLVPPAWQFPHRLTNIQPVEIEYVMGFLALELSHGLSVPLATWSWDWGWLYGSGRLGALLGRGRHLLCPNAIPTIVLHPVDVRRRTVNCALAQIQTFLREGWVPILPQQLAESIAPAMREPASRK